MKMWCFPDGFIGDDPSSKHNARWLGVMLSLFALVVIALSFSGCVALGVGAWAYHDYNYHCYRNTPALWCRDHGYPSRLHRSR